MTPQWIAPGSVSVDIGLSLTVIGYTRTGIGSVSASSSGLPT
jgi:hypothetical protein